MNSDKEQQLCLENKVKEIHNNIRHITQLAMNWFVFFVTINYASMGWLADSSGKLNRIIIMTIAGAFIVQNVLGIVSLYETGNEIKKMSNQVECYKKLSISLEAKSIPIELYLNLRKYMSLVLLSLILAWVTYAFQAEIATFIQHSFFS